jgi:hypothetical protein
MRNIILAIVMLISGSALAADKITCTPSIGPGDVNYADATTDLNRVTSIEVTNDPVRGATIVLNLSGTAGKGEKTATSTLNLVYSKSFGSLTVYDNAALVKNSPTNPYVRFEIEGNDPAKPYFAALTLLSLQNSKVANLLTSRYTCNAQSSQANRNVSGAFNYFTGASKDIALMLANPIFKNFPDYTIDNVRQGEIGESLAYFVRLAKPFGGDSHGICLQFLGAKALSGKPHSCDQVE